MIIATACAETGWSFDVERTKSTMPPPSAAQIAFISTLVVVRECGGAGGGGSMPNTVTHKAGVNMYVLVKRTGEGGAEEKGREGRV